ncbi:2-(1,2-epoxy-1,2-dihydrophenyl)acetyl-CoA isomerase [Thermosporothrix hazakensis]|jgi:2-(1,2-epoxy-1,2-dihydrophenyl)acetyl-CoA isomerase|uniref:2-(1,2-epoxy-1,2-dihydrophenyl)acetyl-CoA isomerase n=1 Tax=Thermosporothrix hazakensis TaxID=644383 RepID=A0A326UUH6_THEHA|nr:enoyl-CoA hydratase [Thermosporothrix hazakensis]PZW36273.1 2-(1,2-epoxy-1,2-dihydrophenyl)acetyl-CoA isomerase [Thermosporothrix hazakensis]GCE46922.1 enoyl-CoA hydratase [Thermosporothrix hazakensis]
MSTPFQHLLLERDGQVLVITMNRPEVLNAINDLMLEELVAVTEEAARDNAIRCVVLRGAGRAFGSGQDLTRFAWEYSRGKQISVGEHLDLYHRLVQALHTMPKPTLAAIHGVAAGISCNIALACDLRIAADDARFLEAFSRIGLVPDGGGSYFLPRLVGLGRALELAMLADELDAHEAERIGLVNRCVPLADFETETRKLAQRLAAGPTRTYALIKELMFASLDTELAESLRLESKLQDQALTTEDHQEGVAAFLQKRPPRFSGR